jgi:GDPmannose 4,6-dehydratase
VKSIDETKTQNLKLNTQNLQQLVGEVVVAVDPRYFRPTEVDLLLGDPTKANTKLGWTPEYDLKALVDDMMQSDLHLMTKDVYLKEGGYKIMSYFE